MEERNTTVSPEGQGRVLYKFDFFLRGGIHFHFVQRFRTRKKYNHQSLKSEMKLKKAREIVCVIVLTENCFLIETEKKDRESE